MSAEEAPELLSPADVDGIEKRHRAWSDPIGLRVAVRDLIHTVRVCRSANVVQHETIRKFQEERAKIAEKLQALMEEFRGT